VHNGKLQRPKPVEFGQREIGEDEIGRSRLQSQHKVMLRLHTLNINAQTRFGQISREQLRVRVAIFDNQQLQLGLGFMVIDAISAGMQRS
jgi:hypothetical protein